MTSTTSESFFEEKYRADDDPWNFAGSPYELARYDSILRALGDRHYELAFEPGCSVGVLTEQLARHCSRVEACDISSSAVEQAKARCSSLQNVVISHRSIQNHSPVNGDLYVLSEIGYYMPSGELQHLLEEHVSHLASSAVVIGCHWLGHSEDHILSGDQVHHVIDGLPSLAKEFSERHEHFILDRWVKQGNR